MTSWKPLVAPRFGTTDMPGMCLRFAQSFFGAPVAHRSAWHAWLATEHRHAANEPLPDVPVLLWFEHWGAYDDGLGPYDGRPVGAVGNWGDVRINVPGDAIYGSPISGTARGQSRVGKISDIERGIGAKFVGWSEDINGLRVAEATTTKGFDMPALIQHPSKSIGFVSDAGELDVITNDREREALEATICGPYIPLPNPLIWDLLAARTARLRAARASVDPAALAAAVAPLLVGAVVEALEDVVTLTSEDVEAAVEKVTKTILRNAAE